MKNNYMQYGKRFSIRLDAAKFAPVHKKTIFKEEEKVKNLAKVLDDAKKIINKNKPLSDIKAAQKEKDA